MDNERTLTLKLKAKNLGEGEVHRFRDALGTVPKAAGKVGSALKLMAKVGAAAILGIVGAVALAGPKLMDIATNLELMSTKAETVFGPKQIGVVRKWADTVSSRMGVSSASAVGLAANFADLLIPMKFTREEATAMSTKVVGLSGALSEWSGGTRSAAEVSDILAKAMLGERESLKELGISILDADVKGRLLKKGQDKLTGSALEQAKAIATQELIFEKSADAQAAYAKGSGTLAGKQAALKAKFDTLVQQLATKLTPIFHTILTWVMDKLVPAVGDFIGKVQAWMDKNKPLIADLKSIARIILDVVVVAIKGMVSALGTVIERIKLLIDWVKQAIQWLKDLNLYQDAGAKRGPNAPYHPQYNPQGQRAMGGRMTAGRSYRMHEDEVFTPAVSGMATPAYRQQGGGPQTIILQIGAEEVARVVTPTVSRQMFYRLQRSAPTLSRV